MSICLKHGGTIPMNRLLDVIFSSFLLIILSPVMLGVGIMIKKKLGSPVIFKQERPGYKGNIFYLYKFRSMKDLKNSEGELLPDSERMTVFGEKLRKYSLDELPQLFNVLKGDMSFIGPRPLLVEYLALYTAEQARRHDVRPGITGWAQVNGRNNISWEEKFKLDVWYVDHASMWLDLKIIWRTFSKVLLSDGVSKEGHVTTDKFTGQSIN